MWILKKLFGFRSKSADDRIRRGIGHHKNRDYHRAIGEFSEAIRLDPNNVNAYRWRSQAYAAIGDHPGADRDYSKVQELRELASTHQPTMVKLAKTFYFQRVHYGNEAECNQAIADITEAMRIQGNNPAAAYNRGVAYFQKGELDRAIEDFTQCLQLGPSAVDAYKAFVHRGFTFLNQGKFREAVADFTEAIPLSPTDAFSYGCRGTAYNELGEFDAAIRDCSEALRLDPDSAIAYGSRRFSYCQRGDYGRAIADYAEAIRLSPENPGLYQNRARAFRASGDEAKAANDERQSQEMRK
jgi:tetratricopeptide (TPR) repeat protein